MENDLEIFFDVNIFPENFEIENQPIPKLNKNDWEVIELIGNQESK